MNIESPIDMCSDALFRQTDRLESFKFDRLKNCGKTFYSGDSESMDTMKSAPTYDDLRKIYHFFKERNATPIPMINDQYGHKLSIKPFYFAFGHTDLTCDIRNIKSFRSVCNYNADMFPILKNEIGFIEDFGIRFFMKSIYNPWYQCGGYGKQFLSNGKECSIDNNYDVYPIIVIAKGAYISNPLSGEIQILNDEFIAVLKCCVTSMSFLQNSWE